MSGLRAILIKADDTQPVQVVEVPDTTAAACAATIGCQWIELVWTEWLTQRHMVMVVDEEGMYNDGGLNRRASVMYGRWPIKGDVLIVGQRPDEHGEIGFASLHPAQVGQIASLSFLDSIPAEGVRL